MAITVSIYQLTGQLNLFNYSPETTIGELLYDIGNNCGPAPFRLLKLIHKCKPLELYGLSNPITMLAEDNAIQIYIPLRLTAASYTLGTLRTVYWQQVIDIVNSKVYTPQQDAKIRLFANFVEKLEKLYQDTSIQPCVNEEDPITLEALHNKMYWIEDGKKFAMTYESLVDYIKKFKYVDENGLTQIPNPYTRQPISEP